MVYEDSASEYFLIEFIGLCGAFHENLCVSLKNSEIYNSMILKYCSELKQILWRLQSCNVIYVIYGDLGVLGWKDEFSSL